MEAYPVTRALESHISRIVSVTGRRVHRGSQELSPHESKGHTVASSDSDEGVVVISDGGQDKVFDDFDLVEHISGHVLTPT